MTCIRKRIAFVLVLIFLGFSVSAQEGEGVLGALANNLEERSNEISGLDPIDLGSLIQFPDGFELSEESLAAAQSAFQGYYDYRVNAFEHRYRVFQWQYYSSIAIFVTVILIVAIGIYFAWRQFHETENKSEMGTTKFEASESGFSISSPVLGVIILLISLAFFYLYLVYVYPINDVSI